MGTVIRDVVVVWFTMNPIVTRLQITTACGLGKPSARNMGKISEMGEAWEAKKAEHLAKLERACDLSPQQAARMFVKDSRAMLLREFCKFYTPERFRQFFETLWERHENNHEASTKILAGFFGEMASVKVSDRSEQQPTASVQVHLHAAELPARKVENEAAP